MKSGGLFLLTFIFFSIFLVSFVIAAEDGEDFNSEDKNELRCLSCGDGCLPYDIAVVAFCSPPTNGEPICGVENNECVVLGFEDDGFKDNPDYMCEDMNKVDCEAASDCESILGPSFCEGDTCTTDMVWKGCRYEGDELFEDYENEKLKQDAGTTPGDTFYFIDKFFDRFGDKLEVKEEKIAEIKAMIEVGDLESAKIALKEYMELAEELENEIEPERKEDALRSAAAIRSAMKDIRDKLPPGERGEFVSEIMKKEHSIATAAEISFKIKELCVQLAELDLMEYSKMCNTDDDSPKWQKKLDKDLSAEQEKIAREFVNTMKQCFKTSGQDCACEEIPFYDFSIACSKAAPLAVACDIDGDEIACDELDNLEMPELPEWLEPIWEDLEMGMMESQYDMHMPPECVEAGVTSPKECGKVMINTHAPLECRAALLAADVQSESEGRKICDKIMFELHSPQECIDKGITDPKECMKFMDSFRGPGGPIGGPGFGGPDCERIEDPTKRLDCYDNKGNEMMDHYGPMNGEMPEGEITWQCKEHRIHWPPDCEKFMREELPEIERKMMEEGDMRRAEEEDWRVKEKQCAASCDLENGWWDFRDGQCICKTDERSDYDPSQGHQDDDGNYYQDNGEEYEDDYYNDGSNFGGDGTSCASGYESDGQGGCIPFGIGDYGFDDSGEESFDSGTSSGEETFTEPSQEETFNEPEPEPEPEESPQEEPESDGMTGAFIDYWENNR